MLKFLNFIIFVGLLTIGITASSNLESEDGVIAAQKLLKIIQSEVDSSHKNHKRQYESKNGANHNLMNIQTLDQILKHNDLRSDTRSEKDDLMNEDANMVNKLICAITGSYGCSKNDDLDQIETDDDKSLSNADLVNEDKKELKPLTSADEDTDPQSNDFDEAKNDLKSLLNNLEKKLLLQEDRELRCRGNRCGRGRLHDRELRIADNKSKNLLRCNSNRCGKHRYYDDDDNRHGDLRCDGHQCVRFRVNDDRRDNELRCRGHRCGRNRVDGDRGEDDRHDHLRCRNNRCKRERAGDDNNDDMSYDTGKDTDELRCRGNQCGEDSNDEYYDKNQKDDSRSDELRCSGNRCGNTRNRDASTDIDSDFKYILDNYGKRYNIYNELDAIVLDAGKLENVLPTVGSSDNSKSEESKDLLRIHRARSSTRSTTDEPPFTLFMEHEEEVPFKLHEPLVTFSDFIAFITKKQKLTPFDKALNYIKDPSKVGSWNEHFKNAGINVTTEDAQYLKKLRNYYHNYVTPPKKNYLPYVEKLLKNQLGTNQIEIVQGKDNKIIVPDSLYFGLLNEANKQKADKKKSDKPLLRSEKKRLLPLTMKQKMRLYLHHGKREKALAPFVLDVKGLGQVKL